MCSNSVQNNNIKMAKTDATNIDTEVYTNEPVKYEFKDESSLALQLAKRHIVSTVYRPVSRRKRCRHQSQRLQKYQQRKQMLHKRMMTSTPKSNQESPSVNVVDITTASSNDIWSAEYKYSLKEVYEQEKIDIMNRKQQWEQQSLNDFEDFHELEQMVRLHDQSEQINETEAVHAFAVQLEQEEADDQQVTLIENKEKIFFFV